MIKKIFIKKTTSKDCDFYFSLRNSYDCRKNSLNTKLIKYEEHQNWFKKNYKQNIFYTCYHKNKRIGYIRGEKKYDQLEISIALIKNFRKKNIATYCFNKYINILRKNLILTASVKKNNKASYKFFLKNNFNILFNDKKIIKFYRINKKTKNFLHIIDNIEKIRSKNNINWMNILRIAFKNSPNQTSKVFQNISTSDKKINYLSNKLSKI